MTCPDCGRELRCVDGIDGASWFCECWYETDEPKAQPSPYDDDHETEMP